MKTNPILDEIWHITDEPAREAGCDVRHPCEDTRKWAAEPPHSVRVIRSAAGLQQFVAEKQRKRAEASGLVLNDKPARMD